MGLAVKVPGAGCACLGAERQVVETIVLRTLSGGHPFVAIHLFNDTYPLRAR